MYGLKETKYDKWLINDLLYQVIKMNGFYNHDILVTDHSLLGLNHECFLILCQAWERGILQEGRNGAVSLRMLPWSVGDAKLKFLLCIISYLKRVEDPQILFNTGKWEGPHLNTPMYLSYMSAIKVFCSELFLTIYTDGYNSNLIDLDNHLSQYFKNGFEKSWLSGV